MERLGGLCPPSFAARLLASTTDTQFRLGLATKSMSSELMALRWTSLHRVPQESGDAPGSQIGVYANSFAASGTPSDDPNLPLWNSDYAGYDVDQGRVCFTVDWRSRESQSDCVVINRGDFGL